MDGLRAVHPARLLVMITRVLDMVPHHDYGLTSSVKSTIPTGWGTGSYK